MDAQTSLPDTAATIASNLPYLRRYARALTGSQSSGDNFAVATLEAILADDSVMSGMANPKTSLFHAFHLVWSSAGAPVGTTTAVTASPSKPRKPMSAPPKPCWPMPVPI